MQQLKLPYNKVQVTSGQESQWPTNSQSINWVEHHEICPPIWSLLGGHCHILITT